MTKILNNLVYGNLGYQLLDLPFLRNHIYKISVCNNSCLSIIAKKNFQEFDKCYLIEYYMGL